MTRTHIVVFFVLFPWSIACALFAWSWSRFFRPIAEAERALESDVALYPIDHYMNYVPDINAAPTRRDWRFSGNSHQRRKQHRALLRTQKALGA